MTSEAKLDVIIEQLKALGPIQFALEDLRASVRDVKEDVSSLQFVVAGHGDRLQALEREMQEQKDISNQQQQQLCSLTLRLMNFPVLEGEAEDNYAGLSSRVYDAVLKPILTAVKAAQDLPSVPQIATVMEACFRPFNAAVLSTSGPPHVIIKISTRTIKIALLKNREHLPKLLSTDVKRYIRVEDLTPATHKTLTAISKSKAAGKIWTIDGVIKFTLEGQATVCTIKSVYNPLGKILMQ